MSVLSIIVRILIITLSIALPTLAQTASELQAKFGAPAETYEISPSVSLTAKFAQDGQACEILIIEKFGLVPRSSGGFSTEVAAVDVLDKLIPETERGAKIHSTSTVGDCFDFGTDIYENVTINRYENSCASRAGAKSSIQVLWKNRRCKVGDTVIDTQLVPPPVQPSRIVPSFSNRSMPQVSASSPCGTETDATYVEYKRVYRKYEVGQSIELLSVPQPELTPEAIANKATGKMIIQATLGPCGEVTNLVMRGHVPFGLTDRVIVAARKLKFRPALENGRPVPQHISLEYSFFLCNKAPICTSVREVVE